MPHRPNAHLIGSIAFSGMLLGLIALAIGGSEPAVAIWSLVLVAAIAIEFHLLLPGSAFFTVVFANSIGIYACLYTFFASVSFPKAGAVDAQIGFVLPLIVFAAAVAVRHKAIQDIVETPVHKVESDLRRSIVWIAPLVVVAASTFVVPIGAWDQAGQGLALIVYMAVIAAVAAGAARDITLFLIDLGLLFEDFSSNAARLVKPAFAFFTWYSLLVIVFGCLYTIIDRFSAEPNFFVLGGEGRAITFAEGLYVSIATLATVGYGDIVAKAPVVRALVAIEIFCGVMLMLFGVQAILSTSPKKRGE